MNLTTKRDGSTSDRFIVECADCGARWTATQLGEADEAEHVALIRAGHAPRCGPWRSGGGSGGDGSRSYFGGWQRRLRRSYFGLLLLLLTSCAGGAGVGERCSSNASCDPGLACLGGECGPPAPGTDAEASFRDAESGTDGAPASDAAPPASDAAPPGTDATSPASCTYCAELVGNVAYCYVGPPCAAECCADLCTAACLMCDMGAHCS